MRRFGWCFVLGCLLAGDSLEAQPAFFRKDIPIADRPDTVVIGDFNGDSMPDMAIGSSVGTSILLNTGRGDFGRPIHLDSLISPKLAADFNGDGRLDLIAVAQAPFPTVLSLLGRGDGTFLPAREVARGVDSGPLLISVRVASGDFNGDGRHDLVLSDVSGTVSAFLMLGNGDGTFQSRTLIGDTPLGEEPFQIEVADFNRDGLSDLVLFDGWSVAMFLGQGDGAFRPAVGTYVAHMPGSNTHYASSGILVGDFNRDGRSDIATRSNVMLGKGNGSFQPPLFFLERSMAKGDYPHPSVATDLNGDGHLDLVISYATSNLLSVFLGKGDGTMLPSVDFTVAPYAGTGTVVAADLDGDGLSDLVTTNFYSNSVSLLLNRRAFLYPPWPYGERPDVNHAVSAASGSTNVAPGSLATLFVSTSATSTGQASPPWPTTLGGISLQVRDRANNYRLAPLSYVSPTQINFQVPADIALGEVLLAVCCGNGSRPAGGMQVKAVAPGLFMVSQPSTPAATAVRVAPDGSQTPVPVFSCSRPVPERPEAFSCGPEPIRLEGDPIYVSFYGTGFHGANSTNVKAVINGVPVPVTYAGPQGTPGLDQINIRLLPELRRSGFVGNFGGVYQRLGFVTLSMDGVVANSVLITFACAAGPSNC
jgi:hypothetical protein